MRFATILGARPQFIKASPLSAELRKSHQEILVHTGQHYDREMSDIFFEDLGIPAPDYHLAIGSGGHGEQTGAMLAAIEKVLLAERPDAVIVYGDTNSTLAGALAAAKLQIPVAHVEAGLRSFNRAMPEELNRVLTDHISRWLFTPSDVGRANLAAEGVTAEVHVVGDIMVDALRLHAERARSRSGLLDRLGLTPGGYFLATMHRAENTDSQVRLASILAAFDRLDCPVLLPLHPRTEKRMVEFQITASPNVLLVEPLGYLDMLRAQESARAILTDSGGVQKEAYYLGVPCITMRDETEWVETLETGWNTLAGADADAIVAAASRLVNPATPHPRLYGDGHAAERIVALLGPTEAAYEPLSGTI